MIDYGVLVPKVLLSTVYSSELIRLIFMVPAFPH